jgi:hypothetical protein
MASLVVAIVAAAAAIVAAVAAGGLAWYTRKGIALPGYLEFFQEYRQYEPDRRYVILDLCEHDKRLGVAGLPAEARKHVVNVCHYLDHLGFLVHRRMISLDAVERLMGDSVLVTWGALRPYIGCERAERDRPYAAYYEDLVAKVYARKNRARWRLGKGFHERYARKLWKLPPDAKLPKVVRLGEEPRATDTPSTDSREFQAWINRLFELVTAVSAATLAAIAALRVWRESRDRAIKTPKR